MDSTEHTIGYSLEYGNTYDMQSMPGINKLLGNEVHYPSRIILDCRVWSGKLHKLWILILLLWILFMDFTKYKVLCYLCYFRRITWMEIHIWLPNCRILEGAQISNCTNYLKWKVKCKAHGNGWNKKTQMLGATAAAPR